MLASFKYFPSILSTDGDVIFVSVEGAPASKYMEPEGTGKGSSGREGTGGFSFLRGRLIWIPIADSYLDWSGVGRLDMVDWESGKLGFAVVGVKGVTLWWDPGVGVL